MNFSLIKGTWYLDLVGQSGLAFQSSQLRERKKYHSLWPDEQASIYKLEISPRQTCPPPVPWEGAVADLKSTVRDSSAGESDFRQVSEAPVAACMHSRVANKHIQMQFFQSSSKRGVRIQVFFLSQDSIRVWFAMYIYTPAETNVHNLWILDEYILWIVRKFVLCLQAILSIDHRHTLRFVN